LRDFLKTSHKIIIKRALKEIMSLGAKQTISNIRSVSAASVSKNTNRRALTNRQQTLTTKARAIAEPSEQLTAEQLDASIKRVFRDDLRNVAIIAHVDHGKTTLVDSMLKQSSVFRENEKVEERIMDSNDLERERGITILSKNTSVDYKGTKLNIVDTPGHADFGGEVERVLNMVDGVLLLVDAQEGPMPQTRFVLKKALALGLKVLVVVNKVDREGARPDWVVDTTFDLFCSLGADDECCDFPVVFCSGFKGIAGDDYKDMSTTLEPLFEAILREVPPPKVDVKAPLQMLVTNLDYDDFKGRIALGRVNTGTISKNQQIKIGVPGSATRSGKVNELFVYRNFAKSSIEEVGAGDICAIAGLPDVMIGETIFVEGSNPLPRITVEKPTVRMSMMVNLSPFAGQEGKYVTSRNIRERLDRELERNLALKVEAGDTADTFVLCGRGALHITILIETMRREGFEFCIGPPEVIMQEIDGRKCEPFEEAQIEVPEDYTGACVDLLSQRKGQMLDLVTNDKGQTTLKYSIPTRGLLGLRNAILTATRGTAVLNTNFEAYKPFAGEITQRDNGSLIAFETGPATSYAMFSAQERGILFVKPQTMVYEGMVVGIHQRSGDLKVNIAKRKAATNVRSNKDATVVLNEPKNLSLDDCVEYIGPDELVEITPLNIRILKNPKMGKRTDRSKSA
jgi:GTP-binding protein